MFISLQIFPCLVTLALSFIIYYYLVKLRKRQKFRWIPQAPRWPIIGSLLEFHQHTDTINDVTRLTDNPSKLSYVEMGHIGNIFIRDYDMTEFVLSSTVAINKSVEYEFLRPWLGTGLLTAPVQKWRRRRKALTPAFHFSILAQFVDVFNHNAKILIKRLEAEALDKESVDIYEYVTACTLDTICESAMGVKLEAQNQKNQDYVTAVRETSRIVMSRIFSPWRRVNFLFKYTSDYGKLQKNLGILHDFTNSVIEKRIGELKAAKTTKVPETDSFGRKRKLVFLDLLLNSTIDGEPLSKEGIREEVDTFMFEGHDTTSSAVSSTLYLLANHPAIQKLVRDEQKQIYGNERDRVTTHQDLQDMRYLELVIKESLRVYPPVALVGRQLTDKIIYKGHEIPKDTILTIFIYGVNRDPDYFEDPNEFKPERFSDTSGKFPYSYIPFSAGPRNCIGQKFAVLEMKSIISQIINNFELFPTDPPHELLLSTELIVKSLNGVKIKLKKHNWESK